MEFSSGLRQVEGQPVSRSDIDASYIPEGQCQQEERQKKAKRYHCCAQANFLDIRQTRQLLIAAKNNKKKNQKEKKKACLPSTDNGRIMILLGRAEPTQTAC